MVIRAMVKRAKEVIVVTDSSKLQQISPALICPLESIHTIVTDNALSAAIKKQLYDRGIKVVLPDLCLSVLFAVPETTKERNLTGSALLLLNARKNNGERAGMWRSSDLVFVICPKLVSFTPLSGLL